MSYLSKARDSSRLGGKLPSAYTLSLLELSNQAAWQAEVGGGGGGGGGTWGSITGTLSDQTDLQSALDAKATSGHNHDGVYQPLDAELTALSGASANGVSLVTAATYAAMRGLLDLEAGTDFYSIAGADAAFSAIGHNHDGSYDALGAAAAAVSAHEALGDPHPQYLTPAEGNAAYQPLDADLTTWSGLTPSANAQSLVTAANYAAMRTLLDLEAGTDFYSIAGADAAFSPIGHNHDGVYQPLDTELTALGGLVSAADKLPYFTGVGTAGLTDLTAFSRTLLDDATAAAWRASLELGSLSTLNTVGTTQIDNDAVTYAKLQNVSVTDRLLGRSTIGSGDVEEIPCTAAGRALLDDVDATAQRATLGLVIGTNVQAFDAELSALAGLTSAADKLPYFTGSGTAGLTDLSAFARTLLDDVDAATARATLGAGTGNGTIGGSTGAADNTLLMSNGTGGSTVQASVGITQPADNQLRVGDATNFLHYRDPTFIGAGTVVTPFLGYESYSLLHQATKVFDGTPADHDYASSINMLEVQLTSTDNESCIGFENSLQYTSAQTSTMNFRALRNGAFNSGGGSCNILTAYESLAETSGGGTTTIMTGGKFDTAVRGGGTSPTVISLYGLAYVFEASSTVTDLYGISGDVQTFTNGSATNGYAIRAYGYSETGAPLTNFYGLYVDTADLANTANIWGVYQKDANAKNQFTGQVTIPNGTLTASKPLHLTQTWNSGGVAFDALLVEITDTASAATSELIDLRVGGASKFSVTKAGAAATASLHATGEIGAGGLANNGGTGATLYGNTGIYTPGFVWCSGQLKFAADTVAQRRVVNGTACFESGSPIAVGNGGPILKFLDASTFSVFNGTNTDLGGFSAKNGDFYNVRNSATDYHRVRVISVNATLSNVTGASVTASSLIPDGAVVVGVTSKVTTGLGVSGGTTGYTIGDGTDPDRWGAITGTASGTTSDNRDWTAGTIECFTSAQNVVITATGGNFDGTGVIYVSVQYLTGQSD